MEKRTMVFIDAQNLENGAEEYYGERDAIDYERLLEVLVGDYDLIRPYVFDSHFPDEDKQDFYYFLRRDLGCRVVSRELEERDTHLVEKGVDIALATELIAQGFNDAYDLAIVVSGDADFERAIRYVQNQGKEVHGAMFHDNAARELKATVDEFVDLDRIADDVRRA